MSSLKVGLLGCGCIAQLIHVNLLMCLPDVELVALAEPDPQRRVVGVIGFNYRFNALYQATKQYVQSGKLGELVCVRSVFSSQVQPLPVWQQIRAGGGGVLLNLALHHMDLVHFLFEQEVHDFLRGYGLSIVKTTGNARIAPHQRSASTVIL